MKRLFDMVVVVLGFPAVMALILPLAFFLYFVQGWPIFFAQTRPGRDGKPFKLYKFRTMREVSDARGLPLEDEVRLTPLGRLLRSTSLDELPELWNVLKGDMSLVGPRPLLMDYLPLYNDEQRRRHEVKPGITGWAQVNGRNNLSWEEKFKLDVWYVEHRTLWLDLKILLLTVKKVISREGINAEGQATCEKFRGSDS